ERRLVYMSVLSKIFGDANQRFLSKLSTVVTDINQAEAALTGLSDEALRAKTVEFKKRYTETSAADIQLREELSNRIRTTLDDDEKARLRKELIALSN